MHIALAARRKSVSRHLSRAGSILCYHSIATRDFPSAGIAHVSTATFLETITAAHQMSEIVPLAELLERHGRGQPTAGLTAITFDDAYASLVGIGDVLRREALPVTVFVVTDASRSGAPFWWDRLDDLAPLIPAQRWRRFENDAGLPESYRTDQAARYGPTRPLRQWILREHLGRWPRAREPLLSSLEDEAGCATLHRPMTLEELEELSRDPLVDIAVHTASHAVLPLLPDDEALREIRDAFRTLHDHIPKSLPILAVPFGLYDRRTARLSHDAGMSSFLTLGNRTLTNPVREHGIPRFCVTAREQGWKLRLRLTGVAEWLVPWRYRMQSYPPLPSPGT